MSFTQNIFNIIMELSLNSILMHSSDQAAKETMICSGQRKWNLPRQQWTSGHFSCMLLPLCCLPAARAAVRAGKIQRNWGVGRKLRQSHPHLKSAWKWWQDGLPGQPGTKSFRYVPWNTLPWQMVGLQFLLRCLLKFSALYSTFSLTFVQLWIFTALFYITLFL